MRIGDAPGCVLPDGRFFVGQVATLNTAIYDPATNAWAAAANKINSVGEESWSLLPDGTIHAVDCSNPPNAEKYIIASNQWVAAGATPQVLVDSISEIGASVLLPDGRLFVIGATGFTALYTPPPIANQAGTWVQGPTIPQVNPGQPLGPVDAPAVRAAQRQRAVQRRADHDPGDVPGADVLLRIRPGGQQHRPGAGAGDLGAQCRTGAGC